MIKPEHLRELIEEVLKRMDAVTMNKYQFYSLEAIELLMMTAAQESWCGRYLRQVGSGPALGIFQIEPDTYHCLHQNFLSYKPLILNMLDQEFKQINMDNWKMNMKGNLVYQIVIARLQYYRKPGSIPMDTEGLAAYYKKWWNTALGDATVNATIDNYRKYAF